MRPDRASVSAAWNAVDERLRSVPILYKILGIGGIVATVFALVMYFQTQRDVARVLDAALGARSEAIATSLAVAMERPLSVGDVTGALEIARQAARSSDDIRYVVLYDELRRAVVHTFGAELPVALVEFDEGMERLRHARRLTSNEGMVFDTISPVLDGVAGFVRVGVTDRLKKIEQRRSLELLLWAMLFCSTVGTGLALGLARMLIRPLEMLLSATLRVREGDFRARSRVNSGDEFGELSEAFNAMAESLENYRHEVSEKEQVRLALIDKIVHAQEQERRLLSRELHDELGQSLSALLMRIQSRRCEGTGLKEDGDMERIVSDMIDEVRRMSAGLRPTVLDDFGLPIALKRLAQDFGARSPIRVECMISPEMESVRLSERVETALYRIAQESLTNIVRHAGADEVSVVLSRKDDDAILIVDDNGRGFDHDLIGKSGRTPLGLTGMRERVSLLGGKFDVDSQIGRGTTIRAVIPFERPEAQTS